jgi:hypothetical protein
MGGVNLGNAEEILKETMKDLGISRDAAAVFVGKTFEYMLKYNDDEKAMAAFSKDAYAAVQNEEAWAIEYLGAFNRKMLPQIAEAYDEAMENGQDPATVISIKLGVPMDAASAFLVAVQALKSGTPLEQVTLAMVLGAQEMDIEEIKRRLGV